MARSDLLLNLVRAGSSGDSNLFRKTVEALIAEERGKKHDVLADRLACYLQSSPATQLPPLNGQQNGYLTGTPRQSHELWAERVPRCGFEDLILPEAVSQGCR